MKALDRRALGRRRPVPLRAKALGRAKAGQKTSGAPPRGPPGGGIDEDNHEVFDCFLIWVKPKNHEVFDCFLWVKTLRIQIEVL